MELELCVPQSPVPLRLSAGAEGEADLARFGQLVTSVWNHIPEPHRQPIVEHWKGMARPFPIFVLELPWFGNPSALATTKNLGEIVAFDCARVV